MIDLIFSNCSHYIKHRYFQFCRTNQDLARIQRAYNDAQTGGSSEVQELITQRMETEMIKYIKHVNACIFNSFYIFIIIMHISMTISYFKLHFKVYMHFYFFLDICLLKRVCWCRKCWNT